MPDSRRVESAAEIAHEWWRSLSEKSSGSQRAAFAHLRRAHTPIDVLQVPQALQLIVQLRRVGFHNADRVAVLSGVLGFVREHDSQSVAHAVGRRSIDDEHAKLSEGRFRRLLQSTDDELMEQMRRVVRMTKGRANVRDLANSILYWGDGARRRWIFDYYAASDSQVDSSNRV